MLRTREERAPADALVTASQGRLYPGSFPVQLSRTTRFNLYLGPSRPAGQTPGVWTPTSGNQLLSATPPMTLTIRQTLEAAADTVPWGGCYWYAHHLTDYDRVRVLSSLIVNDMATLTWSLTPSLHPSCLSEVDPSVAAHNLQSGSMSQGTTALHLTPIEARS